MARDVAQKIDHLHDIYMALSLIPTFHDTPSMASNKIVTTKHSNNNAKLYTTNITKEELLDYESKMIRIKWEVDWGWTN